MRQLFASDQLTFDAFVPASSVDAVVASHQLLWILQPKSPVPKTPEADQPTAKQLQHRLGELLAAETANEAISEYIAVSVPYFRRSRLLCCVFSILTDRRLSIFAQANVESVDKKFIRILTTAVVESSLTPNKLNFNDRQMKSGSQLLQKYIDGSVDLELQCLFAIQLLVNKLEHPSGMFCAFSGISKFEKEFELWNLMGNVVGFVRRSAEQAAWNTARRGHHFDRGVEIVAQQQRRAARQRYTFNKITGISLVLNFVLFEQFIIFVCSVFMVFNYLFVYLSNLVYEKKSIFGSCSII